MSRRSKKRDTLWRLIREILIETAGEREGCVMEHWLYFKRRSLGAM